MAEEQRSDSELITACLAGDRASWDALIRRYGRFLYAMALRAGLSTCDAEDVFQNACIKLYENLSHVRETGRLAGWLGAVVRQEVALLRRRRAHFALSDLDDELRGGQPEGPSADSPEQRLLATEERLLIRAAVEELSADCRSLLSLLYRESPATYAQVSSDLGVPVGTIGPRRSRCLKRLMTILKERGW